MSDAGAGQAGAGDAGAAGAAGAGAGDAGAGAAAAAWHGVPATDADGLAYIANKGWKGPTDVINSYRGAEKLIGKDPGSLIPVPRADDPVGFRAAMQKLGLPETPDKYEFAKPDGVPVDQTYERWARETFHKVGLPAAQVKALTAEHNAFVKATMDQQAKDYALAVDTDKKALLAEWKGGHERMYNAAKTAAKSLGFSPEMIDGIERTVGYAGTWKFFAELGKKMGEDGFVTGGDKSSSFNAQQTPAEAKAEWEKMKMDATAMAALKDRSHPGHASTKAKQAALFSVMYPG